MGDRRYEDIRRIGLGWSAGGHSFDEDMNCGLCGIPFKDHQSVPRPCEVAADRVDRDIARIQAMGLGRAVKVAREATRLRDSREMLRLVKVWREWEEDEVKQAVLDLGIEDLGKYTVPGMKPKMELCKCQVKRWEGAEKYLGGYRHKYEGVWYLDGAVPDCVSADA